MPSTPAGLTYSTTAIETTKDGQIIENLDLWVSSGNAITVTNDNVIIRNCIIHHVSGNGVLVDGASNVTVEDSLIVNASPPSGIAGESEATDINNIWVTESPGFKADHVTLRDGATGIYLGNSPDAVLSHIEGYNFHGPFPAGQFVQFYKSGNGTLSDFYASNPADSSRPEDIVSVIDSPNVTIARGVIDGDNSVSGVGVMFEGNSGGGKVDHVDAIHMGNGAFSSYSDNVSFNYTRSFDNIDADQGRGDSLSNALIWNVSGQGVSITNSTYTHAGNPDNIVWEDTQAKVLDVKEAPTATPMAHITNLFDWTTTGIDPTPTYVPTTVTPPPSVDGVGPDIDGTSGADLLRGTAESEDINALAGRDKLFGFGGKDELWGGAGRDVLHGGAGNDWLYGGKGSDKFVFTSGFGTDSIEDFQATGRAHDVVKFSKDFFSSYASVMATAHNVGADVWIDIGSDHLILNETDKTSLKASDFSFF